MAQKKENKKILIIGGGFGGIETALRLNAILPYGRTEVTLLSDKHHFEYTPALYRVVTGKSPLEVCVPLKDIFNGTRIKALVDVVSEIDLKNSVVFGAKKTKYHYDYLVVALGSESAFFGIPGLEKNAFGFKDITQALKLKEHLHKIVEEHVHMSKNETDKALHIDIVGAGPAGVELAGELSLYTKELAQHHKLNPSEIKIDLIEASPRLVPMMSEGVSQKISLRLKDLGVHLMVQTKVMSTDGTVIAFENGTMPSQTLIWTAGVKPHHLYKDTVGWEVAKNGRIVVDEFLRAKGYLNVFVIGDGAETRFSGTAQTALHDASYVARSIKKIEQTGKPHLPYYPAQSAYILPVGPGWALFTYRNFFFSGRIVWWMRELIELRFFLSILPIIKAWRAWRSGMTLSEDCPTCESGTNNA